MAQRRPTKPHVSVEQVVQLAEQRHYTAVINLAETANHALQQQIACLTRDAEIALQRQAAEANAYAEHLVWQHATSRAAVEAAYSARVSQLEIALEHQANTHAHILAQKKGAGRNCRARLAGHPRSRTQFTWERQF